MSEPTYTDAEVDAMMASGSEEQTFTDEQVDRLVSGVSELRLPAPTGETPGPARTFALKAARTAPGGLQIGALMRTLNELADPRRIAPALYAEPLKDDGLSVVDRYRRQRDELEAGTARGAEANPTAGTLGTVGGYGGQFLGLGGAQALRALPGAVRAIPAAARAVLSNPGQAARGAAAGARQVAPLGAAQGALVGATESSGDLTRGEFGRVGLDSILGAGYGAGISGLIGGALGAPARALQAQSGQLGRAATASEQLDNLAAERAQVPERTASAKLAAQAENERRATEYAARVAEAKAVAATANRRLGEAAEAAARNPDRSNAVRLSGLGGTKADALKTRATAEALFDEPVAEGSGSLLVELSKLPSAERLARARALRSELGATLGGVRREMAQAGVGVEGKVFAERVQAAVGPVRGDMEQRTLRAVLKRIKKGTDKKTGQMSAQQLEDFADELSSLAKTGSPGQGRTIAQQRRIYEAARKASTEQQVELARKFNAATAPEFERAMSKYGLYKELERGSQRLASRDPDNLPGGGIGYRKAATFEPVAPAPVPKPAKVKPEPVPEPEFPGGPDAEQAALDLLERAPTGSLRARLGETLAGGAGAMLASGLAPGHPIIAGRAGAQAGRQIWRAWVNRVRPSTAQLRADAEGAYEALGRYNALFDAAMRKGPQAVTALHDALRDTDPEYAAVFRTGERRE